MRSCRALTGSGALDPLGSSAGSKSRSAVVSYYIEVWYPLLEARSRQLSAEERMRCAHGRGVSQGA